MGIKLVTEQNFEVEVFDSELPVLIEFSAEWCGPCKTVAPELEALSREVEGKAKIVKVDIDRSPILARQFGVRSVPAFVVFYERQPIAARAGAMRLPELRAMLEPVLPRAEGALKPVELDELIKRKRVAAVDVRDAASFGRTHLPGARNFPLETIETRLAELHMLGATPVLYCRTGAQCKELAERLGAQGMPVAFLEGGLLDWEAQGLPIERG